MLTEAVRRRPYSVVLLDEVEKAHPDVHEIFFQVFDKGWMEDGEGRRIDFKNTLILLTTNVGTDLIVNMCKDPELMPDAEGLAQGLAAPAVEGFPAGPAGPSGDHSLLSAQRRDGRQHRPAATAADRKADPPQSQIPFTYGDDVVKLIAGRCTELESGGRMIDAILTNTVLPAISRELLTRMIAGKPVAADSPVGLGRGFCLQF